MRKYIKKQLVEIANTLINAERVLRKLILKKDNESINMLLKDMQAAAIEMGETIDQYQEGEEAVHLLEDVCEILWDISQKQMNEKNTLCNSYGKKMQLFYRKLMEFPEEIEIVFMPYKASMWTSLESIWEAANQDEACHATVMPIPYFDLDANGNRVKLNYEGNLFPDEVPITNYADVDLKRLHPEVIYIHNPYDGYNNLTQVPEVFYAKQLKDNTECLVYSPYSMESRTSDSGLHQLFLPGYQYADKIVVQNRKMGVLCRKAGIPEEKLLIYGSPKLDAINKLKKTDTVWKWDKGSELQNKKIILLNIHLSYLTKANEKLYELHLKVINKVIDLVENDDELALIVRPHPLIKTWIAKTYPQRLDEYLQIEKRIECSPKCVKDDTGSYQEAFALSAAMISTFSSLITEYMATYKPILIVQNSPAKEKMDADVVSYAGNYFTTDQNSELLLPIAKFLEMIKEGRDPLLEQRKEIVRTDLICNRGCIGEKIYQKVKEHL